ncbi:DUF397 domain-containing protein [Streptomyces sp. A012304]|uniref:DUF397 domain-containing protein n=1 Tax=Streptomyces sp. A012304 TaxID=375446 RepID=UPI0022307220|nr:DUF397 domain-containing protein [Streptomyces sp. A012304]GKQ34325.1 toxin [Streptomyces sp. A012304]
MNATAQLAWFKSSYSSAQGDSCVEIAVTWRKSSYSSDQGDDCVEVARTPATIHIRDSKDPARPHLTLAPAAWAAFLTGERTASTPT